MTTRAARRCAPTEAPRAEEAPLRPHGRACANVTSGSGLRPSLCRHRADDQGASASFLSLYRGPFPSPSILLPFPLPWSLVLLSPSSLPPSRGPSPPLLPVRGLRRKGVPPLPPLRRRRRRRRLRVPCQGQLAGSLGRPPARHGAAPRGSMAMNYNAKDEVDGGPPGAPGGAAKNRRPDNTAFKQQRLPAWQPILTAGTVLPTFFIIGLIFIPIGIGIFVTSNNIREIEVSGGRRRVLGPGGRPGPALPASCSLPRFLVLFLRAPRICGFVRASSCWRFTRLETGMLNAVGRRRLLMGALCGSGVRILLPAEV